MCKKTWVGILSLVLLGTGGKASSETLDIDPVAQLSPVWCWVAVTEMAMRHYDVPTVNPAGIYQCGIIGAIAYGTASHACTFNCSLCNVPAGSANRLVQTLEDYPRLVRQYSGQYADDVDAVHKHSDLDASDVVDEIDAGNPIIAGISPSNSVQSLQSGTSEHVAVIIGYEDDGDTLIVNDPFPFARAGMADPYLNAGASMIQEGSYEIDRDAFVNGLNWRESITLSASLSSNGGGSPSYCCTAAGKLGPYPNPGIPAGGACFGTSNGIQFTGQACY